MRLLGTWKAEEAVTAGMVTRADSRTFDYLVFAPKGVLTRFEGKSRVPFTWRTSGHTITMWEVNTSGMGGGPTSRAALHFSVAFVALESSRHISYTITPKGLTLSGRSRLRGTGVTPPLHARVLVRYVHEDGPPPSPPS